MGSKLTETTLWVRNEAARCRCYLYLILSFDIYVYVFKRKRNRCVFTINNEPNRSLANINPTLEKTLVLMVDQLFPIGNVHVFRLCEIHRRRLVLKLHH